MDLWSALRSRRVFVPVVSTAIALLVAVALLVVLPAINKPSADPTPLQQVLREIHPDGTWSQETALRAFAAVFGPLPGVVVPEGPEAEVEFGTIALRMLALYIDEITAEQREAALEAAGPLARFLDPDADLSSGSARPVVAMGVPDLTTVLAADSDGYETEIESIITGIESRIGRPLGIDFDVVVSPEPIGILHATANPTTSDGENISGCEVTILPNAQALSGKNLTAVLAHETWHCFEFSRLGTMSRRKGSPPWIIEGQAMWVGEAFVGGSEGLEPADRHWKEYLIDPGPGTGLFARSYDAIGFYSHLHDQGIDPWTVLDPILDQTSNLAAFNIAVGGQSLDVVTTWAPSWYRDGLPTSTFALVNAPGIPGPGTRPVPATFTISSGTFQQVSALDPLSAAVADVGVEAEILTIDVIGQGVVGDMVFGEEIVFVANTRTFCMVEDCTCPDGTPGPSDHLGDELRVAVTGDALSGSDAQLRGWSIQEWCQQEDEEPPPAPPGSGGGPGSPCEGGCASSNGDPHLTTIDGRAYDFQAAGEFVMLRSDDVEIQARQEPYRQSTSVTINTGLAVAAQGGRVAVYAHGLSLRLFVDGTEAPQDQPTSSGGLQITPVVDGFQIVTPDGTTIWALGLGEWGINILVDPSPGLRQEASGLLSAGGAGRLPALPDGTEVDDESDYHTALYTDLADGWAVTPETTLFDYEEGANSQTYRDRSVPEAGTPIDFFDLSEALQELGLDECGAISDEALLIQCAFDVAITGDAGFVGSYESTDQFVTTVSEEEPGSITAGPLAPLLENVSVVSGSGLDDDGMLYLSIGYEDQRQGLVAIDPVGQVVVAQIETEDRGQLASAADSVWVSTTTEGGCIISRFDRSLLLQSTIEVECVLSLFPPQLIAAGDAIWVHQPEVGLRRIDPADNTLGESVPLPFPNGYLRSTGDTIFYSDPDEGTFALTPGAGAFAELGTESVLVYPGGDGVWEQSADSVLFYAASGVPPVRVATDGTLVGAIEDTALVERNTETGPELWGYPADSGTPTLLATGPTVGSGSEQTTLDYFDNDPPITSGGLIVKFWVVHPQSDDSPTALFVQAITPPR